MRSTVNKVSYLRGEVEVAPDKSISHRTVILSALAEGRSRVKNFLQAEDTLTTCNVCSHWDFLYSCRIMNY